MQDSAARSLPAPHRWPPQVFLAGSAVFHYLGPAFAVLLFASVAPLGVAWLRIGLAGLIFAAWRRPWRFASRWLPRERGLIATLGLVLAAMNCVFYLAIERLPLATVGAIEFLGPIALAAAAARSVRNWLALALTIAGLAALTRIALMGDVMGFALAVANGALFTLYVVVGHRLVARGAAGEPIDRLAAAMLVAALLALPVGLLDAVPAMREPRLLAAAFGVAVTSSVIPYVCDQLAMQRLPRG